MSIGFQVWQVKISLKQYGSLVLVKVAYASVLGGILRGWFPSLAHVIDQAAERIVILADLVTSFGLGLLGSQGVGVRVVAAVVVYLGSVAVETILVAKCVYDWRQQRILLHNLF